MYYDHTSPAAAWTSTGGARAAGAASSRLGTAWTVGESAARYAARPGPRYGTSSGTLHTDIEAGLRKPRAVTVQEAAEDWLAHGLDGRSAKTARKNRDVLMAVLAVIGPKRLRELTAAEVQAALASLAATGSTSTVTVAHNCLTRLIRYAGGETQLHGRLR